MTRWTQLEQRPPAEPLVGRLAGSSDTILPRDGGGTLAPSLVPHTLCPSRPSPADHCVDASWPRPGVHPSRDTYDRSLELYEDAVLASLASSRLAHPTNSGEELSSFLGRCVRNVVARAHGPVTAFEVAREVAWRHPGRWAESSVRKKCSQLAKRGVLTEVDCHGVSLDHAPCFRYVLGDAA